MRTPSPAEDVAAWADCRRETQSLVWSLLLREGAESLLMHISPGVVILSLPGGARGILIEAPTDPSRLTGAVESVLGDAESMRQDLILVGGGPAERAALLAAHAVARSNVHPSQWTEDGTWWADKRPSPSVSAAVEELRQGRAPSADPARIAAGFAEARARTEASRAELMDFQARVQRNKPVGTYALLGLIGVTYLLSELWGGSSNTATLVRMGANIPGAPAEQGWRLFSSAFLHAGLMHLGFNGAVIWSFGRFLEQIVGTSRYLVLFAVAVLGGSAASYFTGSAISVGASGGLWGLLSAAAWLAWRDAPVLPTALAGPMRRSLTQALALNFVVSFLPQVDAAAHFGGGAAGVALAATGWLSQPGRRSPIGGLLCVLALVGSLAQALWTGQAWQLGSDALSASQTLGDSSVDLRLPVVLGPAAAVQGSPGTWAAGDLLRDGMATEITLLAASGGPADITARQTELDDVAAQLLEMTEAGSTHRSASSTRTDDGWPIAVDIDETSGGWVHRRAAILGPTQVVMVHVFHTDTDNAARRADRIATRVHFQDAPPP